MTLKHCTCCADPAGLDEPLLGACNDEGEDQHGNQHDEPCRSGRKAGSAIVPYSINAYDWPDLLRSLAAGAANGLRSLKGAIAHVMPHNGACLPASLPASLPLIRCGHLECTVPRKSFTRRSWPRCNLGTVGQAVSLQFAMHEPRKCKSQKPAALPAMSSPVKRRLSRHVSALMSWLLLQRRWRGACRGGGPVPPPTCLWGSWRSCSACGIAFLCPTILTCRSTRFFPCYHCIYSIAYGPNEALSQNCIIGTSPWPVSCPQALILCLHWPARGSHSETDLSRPSMMAGAQ